MFISRIANDKRKQPTTEHLAEVAELSSKWAEFVGFARVARITALLHDMGKFSEAFVAYLYEQDKCKRGSVIHSTQGAKYIYEAAIQGDNISTFIAEMVGLCVAGHHGVLMDGLSPCGETPFLERILTPDTSNLHFDEVKAEFKNNCLLTDLEVLLEASKKELQRFIEVCHTKNLDAAFMIHMLTKFLFSCLVDADRCNAYCFETGTKIEPVLTNPLWDHFSSHLKNFLANKNEKSGKPIDRTRRKISDKCLAGANRPRGIYQLEVPTGGGKTLSSLRFALDHARIHGMERIIYVIPYLSVLEQTADSIREALGLLADDPSVLEHHSNIIPPDDEEKAKEIKLLTDRWDAPIVITTVIQFLESVFSEKASRLRKFHNMANAVLIFDEVQSLPVKCVHLFNEAVNFLSAFGKSTVLLCTATQPMLDRVEHPIYLSGPNLIENMENDFSVLNRTRIIDSRITGAYTYEELTDFVLDKQCINENCLVILNTKKTVTDLFNTIKTRLEDCGQPVKLYHLSTFMCPAHRIDVLKEIKTGTDNHEPIICISSQLIEAGVDISFGCVIRACAGLDSIAQTAGRCNRHGEDPNGRKVYIVNIAGESLSRLPDIKIGAKITERVIDEQFTDLLSKQAMERYYSEYFYRRAGEMNYNFGKNGNLYDLLSVNKEGCFAYRNRLHHDATPPQFRQALQTAGENFCVIENNTIGVLVPYGEGAVLAEEYRRAELSEKKTLLRKMGRYSVSLYQYQVDKLSEAGALLKLNDDLLLLDKEFYYDERGVDLEKDMKFLCN
ncbi:MAG: CRISPR-associated helicase Cas3' [Christensenellales bacterium]|jgi:CRISPR-associated endonuclease/helicase Cas3